jgi:hypothetical protein
MRGIKVLCKCSVNLKCSTRRDETSKNSIRDDRHERVLARGKEAEKLEESGEMKCEYDGDYIRFQQFESAQPTGTRRAKRVYVIT